MNLKIPSKKIVFFGNERLVSGLQHTDTPILQSLIASYDVVAVVSHNSMTRSRKKRELEVADIANQHGITVLTPEKPLDVYSTLEELKSDIGVLVAYGRIIPQKIIDLFPYGIINVHPSLLPKYRGSTPIESTILARDSITGTSIMQLTKYMDEGPVYAQQEAAVSDTDTKFELYEKLVDISSALLLSTLPRVFDGSIQPTPQDSSKATYCPKFDKKDGLLDPNHLSAHEANAHVRAFLGFPGSRITLGSVDVIITSSHVSDEKTKLSVQCSDGKYLAIDYLKPLGKKEMPARAFLAGYKDKL